MRIFNPFVSLAALAVFGCGPCDGKKGEALQECAAAEVSATDDSDPEPQAEDEANNRELEDAAWLKGAIQESNDEDTFTFRGKDGMGSVVVEVEHVGASQADTIDVVIASTWNNATRADDLEGFHVEPGETSRLQFGSYVDRLFVVKVASKSRTEYRIRVSFDETVYETETAGYFSLEADEVFGRVLAGDDHDPFLVQGSDGMNSATLEVQHLGDEQDPSLEVRIGNSNEVNSDVVMTDQSFSVAPGGTESLTIGSKLSDPSITQFVNLVAARGPVPYRIKLTYSDAVYEFEDGPALELESDVDAFGRLHDGADEDQFTITGVDGSDSVEIEVEELGTGISDSKLTVTVAAAEPTEFELGAGELHSVTIPLALGKTTTVTLKAEKGVVPYRIRATSVNAAE